jgi:putative restriction endonuclease
VEGRYGCHADACPRRRLASCTDHGGCERCGSEAHDKSAKRADYASVGVPQYWIVEFKPVPRIEVLHLTTVGTYESAQVPEGDQPLAVTRPFEITIVPSALLLPSRG